MISFVTIGMVWLGGVGGVEKPAGEHPQANAIHVVCHGKLRHGPVAIGGETTGTTITFDGMTWELKLPDEASRRFAQEQHKQHVTVTGRLRRVGGVEIPNRWVVDAEKLTKREMKAVDEKAEVTITGQLPVTTGKALPKSIDVGGESWPVVWGDRPDLHSQAASLAGKAVVAQGTAEANTEGGPKKYPIFHIQQLHAK